jgi:hypothetical protein
LSVGGSPSAATLTISFDPPNPSIPADIMVRTVVARVVVTWTFSQKYAQVPNMKVWPFLHRITGYVPIHCRYTETAEFVGPVPEEMNASS